MTAAKPAPSKRKTRTARVAVASDAERERLARKSARQGRRKEEIVVAALALAEERGLDGFTAEDVAKRLGMSTPSVFYYFPGGLTELRAAAAVRRFWQRLEPVVRAVGAAPSGSAALVAWVRGSARAYAADPAALGKDLEVMQRGAWGPELVELNIGRLNALFSVVEQKLEADRAAGRLSAQVDNLRRLAMLTNQLMLGLIVGDQMIRKVGGGSKHAFDALVNDLCGLLERGVAAEKKTR